MAFCIKCGATVDGAFCGHCGTPVAERAPGAGMSSAGLPPVAAPAPVRRRNTWVWVLGGIAGFIVLVCLIAVGAGVYFVRQFRHNPGQAMARMLQATHSHLQVLRTDDAAQTITLRDDRTGKEVTITFDQVRNGNFNFRALSEDGKAEMSFGEGASLPDWVPVYPGVKPKATASFSGGNAGEGGEAGNFTFTTPDPVSDVTAFYERKFDEMGFNEGRVKTSSSHQATVAAKDAEREIHVTATKVPGDTSVNVTYARKR